MKLAPLLAALALAGCATVLPAPVAPTPAEIAANVAAVQAAALDPQTYLISSVDLSIGRCQAWLDGETSRNNQLSTDSTLVGITGAAIGGAIGVAGGPPGAIAGTAIGTGAAQSALAASAGASGITNPVETGLVIEQEQNAALGAYPPMTSGPMADIYSHRFAEICSQRGAQAAQAQALLGAQAIVIGAPTASTAFAAAPRAGGGFQPPPQVIVR
jgi:hypothetical protein